MFNSASVKLDTSSAVHKANFVLWRKSILSYRIAYFYISISSLDKYRRILTISAEHNSILAC